MVEVSGYDATGNRTSLTTAAGTSTYSYQADSHHLVAVGGEARGHDAAGNTTSIGGKAFTYNDANRMNAVKLGGSVAERYGYNHRGERVLRAPEGGNAQITVYDEAGRWMGNYSATGQAQQQAIWLDDYPVALINAAGAGVPEVAYIQPDHLGSPRVVIDPVRDVAIWEWSNKSEVFGDQAPGNDPDGDGVAFELALRFPGQQATDASGLFYNYQREYDPVVGRYSQSDPIGLKGGLNTFAYVDGDPLLGVDIHGLANSGKTEKIVGGRPTTVRVDNPHVDGQQRHAHVCAKGCKEVIVNQDGSGSHGTDPGGLSDRVKQFLRGKGFSLSACAGAIGVAKEIAREGCERGDPVKCDIFKALGGEVVVEITEGA